MCVCVCVCPAITSLAICVVEHLGSDSERCLFVCVACLLAELSTCVWKDLFVCFFEETLIENFALAVPKEGHKNLQTLDHWYMCSNSKKKKGRTPPAGCSAQVTLRRWAVGEKGARLGQQWQSCETQHGEVIRYQCGCRPAGSFLFLSFNMCLGITFFGSMLLRERALQPTTNAKVVTHRVSRRW